MVIFGLGYITLYWFLPNKPSIVPLLQFQNVSLLICKYHLAYMVKQHLFFWKPFKQKYTAVTQLEKTLTTNSCSNYNFHLYRSQILTHFLNAYLELAADLQLSGLKKVGWGPESYSSVHAKNLRLTATIFCRTV